MAGLNINIQEMQELAGHDLPSAVAKVKEYCEQLDRVELNIAVTGESGAGKSKFVNAFRGMGDEEKGSAETGAVETTKELKAYTHPKYPNVKMWDLPGIGTPNFKADDYLNLVHFERYDFFIIIAADRFRECHADLAGAIVKMDKKFYFVRSKIDTSISGEQHKRNFNEKELLKKIRENCIKGLERAGVRSPVVFLISSCELARYDFSQLQQVMEDELPQQKRHVLLMALPNISLKINEKKKAALESNIWRLALISAGAAAVPLPGLSLAVDLAILVSEIMKYYITFGLDPDSLQKLSESSGKSLEELTDVMKSPLSKIKVLTENGIRTLLLAELGLCSALAAEETAEYLFSLIPLVGSVIAAGMSFTTVYLTLERFLNGVAEDAQKVLKVALQTSV